MVINIFTTIRGVGTARTLLRRFIHNIACVYYNIIYTAAHNRTVVGNDINYLQGREDVRFFFSRHRKYYNFCFFFFLRSESFFYFFMHACRVCSRQSKNTIIMFMHRRRRANNKSCVCACDVCSYIRRRRRQ